MQIGNYKETTKQVSLIPIFNYLFVLCSGPYTANLIRHEQLHVPEPSNRIDYNESNHDTIGVIAINSTGSMAAATSTNGARNKIPGRVGDSPIIGSGAYVDSDIGGCVATGDGDIMMRFSPCYQACENLRRGMSPTAAAQDVINRIVNKYQTFQVQLICISYNNIAPS
jgi:N4-(beta-N-acetylglucosaminyl)-L-asparaginase